MFIATRFDRDGDARVHAEDFGQILDVPPGERQYRSSFEAMASVIRYICPADAAEFVRRFVFMVLSGNGDAHLKNWGVVYGDRGQARLSPAYDLVSTVCRRPAEDLAMPVFGRQRFEDIDEALVVKLGAVLGLSAEEVHALVSDIRARSNQALAQIIAEGHLLPEDARTLHKHLASCPLGSV